MVLTAIGKAVFELRKANDITQECLAGAVGVSAQAVSKWESGGTPDIELLPAIADYFGVTIDSLFGRAADGINHEELERHLNLALAEVPLEHRFRKAFDYCWAVEKGLMGYTESTTSTDEVISKVKGKNKAFSQVLCDSGISTMSLNEGFLYFLLMPEPAGGWSRELGCSDRYAELFSFLSDKSVLKILHYLYGRDNKPFTPKMVVKALGKNEATANSIIDGLLKHKFIWQSTIELDDELKTVYNFTPNPAFVAVLALLGELIEKPCWFEGAMHGRSKPYHRQVNHPMTFRLPYPRTPEQHR